jgi:GNAT superfamily N-acetyltransferase
MSYACNAYVAYTAGEPTAMIIAMNVEVWDARRFTPQQARAIGELIHATWPKPQLTAADRAIQQLGIGAQYVGPARQAPRAMVVVEGSKVLAHAAIVPRFAATASGDLAIAGLARVCTAAEARGRGLGRAVVRAVFEVVDAGDFDFSLFQTKQRLRTFYEGLGATLVDNKMVNSTATDPAAEAFWDEVAMRYPAHGQWPQGCIDLRGPGF